MKDKIGNEITVGCFIAYGHNLGRCAGLRIGRVESVNVKSEKAIWDEGKIIDTSTVTVLSVDDDWGNEDENVWNTPHILEKRSTLFFPNRMIVLSSNTEKYLKLYEKDCVANGKKHKWEWDDPKCHYSKHCDVCGNRTRY
jgi:hypothetical protein